MQSAAIHPHCVHPEERSSIRRRSGGITGVAAPGDKDVLCGRGTSIQKHRGNLAFRELICQNKKKYFDSKRSHKLKVAQSVVKAVKDSGGRFLERDGKSGVWIEVSTKKSIEKACQALREGQPAQSKRSVIGKFLKEGRSSGSSKSKSGIKIPNDNDVLCGRGSFQKHVGNKRFREIVDQKKVVYATSKKSEKVKISKSIVRLIKDHGGRFLERDGGSGLWFEVSEKKALEKTSQTLREGQPSLLKSLVSSDREGASTPASTHHSGDDSSFGSSIQADDFPAPTMSHPAAKEEHKRRSPLRRQAFRGVAPSPSNLGANTPEREEDDVDIDSYAWCPESSNPRESNTQVAPPSETPSRGWANDERKEEIKEEPEDYDLEDFPVTDLEAENAFVMTSQHAPASRRCSSRRSRRSSARSSMISRLSILSDSELDAVLAELAKDFSTGRSSMRSSIRSSIKLVGSNLDEHDIQTIFETPQHNRGHATDRASFHKSHKNASPRHSMRSSIRSSLRSSLRSSMMSVCSQALADIRSFEGVEMDDFSVVMDDETQGLASCGDISKTQSWDLSVPNEDEDLVDIQGKQYEETMRNISGILLQSYAVPSAPTQRSRSFVRSSLAKQAESLLPPGAYSAKDNGMMGIPSEIVIQ